jgi:hypothetical protein
MTRDEFNNLQVGQYVYDREFNVDGEVKEGPWSNWGCLNNKKHDGKHIVWDDGDRSEVGLEFCTDEEIETFEIMSIVPT